MNFRAATSKDLPFIMNLIQQARQLLYANHIPQWQDGYPDEACILDDIKEGISYILEDKEHTQFNHGIIATAVVTFQPEECYDHLTEGEWLNNQPYGAIHRVAVDGHIRGKGIAGQLFAAAGALCLGNGVKNIRVDTHRQNTAMQNALTKFGFIYCGVTYLTQEKKLDDERLVFQKVLG